MDAESELDGWTWNTWDPERPASFVHVPSGFGVRLSAFGAREGRYSSFAFEPASMRLGPHATDGSFAELELVHAGARLRVRFAQGEPGQAVGDVEVLETAEWGLRYWFVLAAGFHESLAPEAGHVRLRIAQGRRYVEAPVVLGASGKTAVAFTTSVMPVGAHLYEDPTRAQIEFEEGGYYARPVVRQRGRWGLYRFNAVTPRAAFSAVVAASPHDEVLQRVRASVTSIDDVLETRFQAPAPGAGNSEAVRDVLGWNTVFDPVNHRPYTVATRDWVAKRFGGWIVWQMDAFLHAIMAAELGDRRTAVANLDAGLSLATQAGNLAALGSGVTHWVDRSHPPLGAFATWWAHRRLDLPEILDGAFPILLRAHRWWFANRDGNGDGLLEYGSSPVGDGHFVHTKLAAMDESAMDNSPVHDEATFLTQTHTLDTADVGLNSLLVLDAQVLGLIAHEIGRSGDVEDLGAEEVRLAELVRERLWDGERGAFANRLWDGRFVRSLAPTSAYPLLAGVATSVQANVFVREHLLSPARFWGKWPVAGTPHDDPAAQDNVYWRGRLWPPFNFLVYLALRRYGYDAPASELAERGARLFHRHWADRRCYENLDQETGEGDDSPDSDPFYSWGALLPVIAELDGRGVDPWVEPLDLASRRPEAL